MMKLGIDFGTNRTVVAAADRGNYPLLSFEGPEGASPDWFPSLVAVRGQERRYGWDAAEVQTDDSWTVIRSLKRLLEEAGPHTLLEVGDQHVAVFDLLNGLAQALHEAIRERSNLHLRPDERLQAVLGIPANSNTNQRFLTMEAFRAAGFQVLGMLNEPSAASIEFGHKQRQGKAAAETILVYDLGGGTFDASLVTIDDNVHHVIGSEGIPTVGGDDFDQILADMALEAADVPVNVRDALSAAAWFRLLEECRMKKEALNPNSRRIVIDLESALPEYGCVQLPVADFYELARPLMEETIAAAEELTARHGDEQFDALYVTGGGSELPLVARVLRERFGRRVRRSAYTRSATAIGLAIQGDHPESYRLSDRLARYFGVWREAEGGTKVTFDPIFAKGLLLPAPGEPAISIVRSYSPVHNVGHFRFLECSHRSLEGSPTGEVTSWDEIYFPFDPSLRDSTVLAQQPVAYSGNALAEQIEERYTCDATGSMTVEIANVTSDYSRTFRLGHWAKEPAPAKRARKRPAPESAAHSAGQ